MIKESSTVEIIISIIFQIVSLKFLEMAKPLNGENNSEHVPMNLVPAMVRDWLNLTSMV
jgi:hypothetical protein